MLGKEKNRNASPCYQLCRTSSHLGEFSLGWFGVVSEASWERSLGCWPLRLAGVFNRGGGGGRDVLLDGTLPTSVREGKRLEWCGLQCRWEVGESE